MQTLTIKTWKDPYDAGYNLCKRRNITLNKGLTVLVGCNGSGKTTLINNIKDELEKQKIPIFTYDNLHEGGSSHYGAAIDMGDIAFLGTSLCSSEGENITLNLSRVVMDLREFIITGTTAKERKRQELRNMFKRETDDSKETNTKIIPNTRIILLDAIDSGYSIDNIIELKYLFNLILEESEKMNIDTYIIISANEYELVSESPCFDVTEGIYRTFKTYNSFKKFILKSREKKNKLENKS